MSMEETLQELTDAGFPESTEPVSPTGLVREGEDLTYTADLSLLATALATAHLDMAVLGPVPKSGYNTQFGKYATLDDVIGHTKGVIAKHGLSVIQMPTGHHMQTMLIHKSGQYIRSRCKMVLPQSVTNHLYAGACTYAKRVGSLSVLNVAPGDDDDGNASTAAVKEEKQIQQQARQQNRGSFYQESPAKQVVAENPAPPTQGGPPPPPEPERNVPEPPEEVQLKGGYSFTLPKTLAAITKKIENADSMEVLGECEKAVNDMVRSKRIEQDCIPTLVDKVSERRNILQNETVEA